MSRRTMRAGLIVATAIAVWGSVWAATGQEPPPPPIPQPPRLLPGKYNALLYRDIFTRDLPRYGPGSPFNTLGGDPRYASRATTTPSTQPGSTQPVYAAASPESALSLRGVVDWGGTYVAFIEDAASGQTLILKSGDPAARGKVSSVDLHGLDYMANGKTQHVNISENFLGVLAAPVTESTPYASAAPAQPGAAPGAPQPGAAPAPPPLPAGDSIEERMRRRRQSEGAR